jgi:hypothetical protein
MRGCRAISTPFERGPCVTLTWPIERAYRADQPPTPRARIRQLVQPTTSAEGPGWVVLIINDKVPVEAVGPMPSSDDAEGERRARSEGVPHGSVAPLRPRGELPGLP